MNQDNKGLNREDEHIEAILGNIRGIINGDSPNTEVFELTEKVEQDSQPDKNISGNTRLSSGKTLEELVTDLLKPQIKTWLNDNLPLIVNTMVQKEIKKIIPQDE